MYIEFDYYWKESGTEFHIPRTNENHEKEMGDGPIARRNLIKRSTRPKWMPVNIAAVVEINLKFVENSS